MMLPTASRPGLTPHSRPSPGDIARTASRHAPRCLVCGNGHFTHHCPDKSQYRWRMFLGDSPERMIHNINQRLAPLREAVLAQSNVAAAAPAQQWQPPPAEPPSEAPPA